MTIITIAAVTLISVLTCYSGRGLMSSKLWISSTEKSDKYGMTKMKIAVMVHPGRA